MPIFLLDIIDDPDDKQAFEIIYKQYEQLLFYQANQILHDEKLSEDAVIETFTALAKHFDKTDKKVCPRIKKFLIIINRNVCVDILRKNKHETPAEPDYFTDNGDLSVQDASETYAEAGDVKRIILGMPEIYRDTLYLAYVEEFSVKEIAVILNVSEDTVYKRIQRGRSMIIREYGDD